VHDSKLSFVTVSQVVLLLGVASLDLHGEVVVCLTQPVMTTSVAHRMIKGTLHVEDL
jgi:hypothetical protein